MKRRVLSLLLILALIGGMAPAQAAGKKISHSDEGFVQDVQQVPISGGHYMETATPEGGMVLSIGSAADFEKIRSAPAECYVLTNDIDLGEWSEPFAFSGVLVGNGHTISYRSSGRMNQGDHFACGLFTKIDRAYIENLCVQAVIDDSYADVSGVPVYIGGIAAQAGNGAYLNNCVVNAKITVSTVQWLDSERTKHEAVRAVDTAALGTGSAQTAVGGMIGYIEAGTDASIYACRSTGMIAGADCTGGLIGQSEGIVSMLGCENRAAVSGVICVGGLIGSASGECYIAQSGNRGEIIAYSAYAGGLAGSVTCFANDSIKDCANVGTVICGALDGKGKYAGGIAGNAACAVLRCVNMAKIVGQDPQPYVGNTENAHLWDTSLYNFALDEDYLFILETFSDGYSSSLNMAMTWQLYTDLNIPYPRVLCGETVNQYRVAYVENLQDVIDSVDHELVIHMSKDMNMAGKMGANYRRGMHNEINTAWSAIMSLSKVLDYDLSAFDELAKYDALLCDLMLSPYMYTTSQKRAENEAYDQFMEANAMIADTADTLIDIGAIGLRIGITGNYCSFIKNVEAAKKYWDSHAGHARQLMRQGRRSVNATQNMMDMDAKYSEITGVADILFTYFSVYESRNSESELLNAASDVYAESFAQMDYLMRKLYSAAQSNDLTYPEPVDAELNQDLLAGAINNLRVHVISRESHPLLSAVGQEFSEQFVAMLGGSGALAELMYLEKLQNLNGCKWLDGLGLYKIAISIGRGMNSLIGNEDYAYNGNLLNCTGYTADLFQPILMETYDTYVQNPTYDNAIHFRDAVLFYFSLQILACDYAVKMDESIAGMNYEELSFFDELAMYKGDVVAILEAFSDY